MPETPSVEKLTGEDVKGTAWGVIGATVAVVVLAPIVAKYLGISATLALIIAGIGLAYFGRGLVRKMGQGAAMFGLTSWVVAMLGPVVQKMNPLAPKNGASNASGVLI